MLVVIQVAKRAAQIGDLLRIPIGLLIHGGDLVQCIRGARIGGIGLFRRGTQLGLVAFEVLARLVERGTLLLLRRALLVNLLLNGLFGLRHIFLGCAASADQRQRQ